MVAVAEYVCSGSLLVGFGVKFMFVSSVSVCLVSLVKFIVTRSLQDRINS